MSLVSFKQPASKLTLHLMASRSSVIHFNRHVAKSIVCFAGKENLIYAKRQT